MIKIWNLHDRTAYYCLCRDLRLEKQELALACALHNRCGAQSPARVLSQALIHEIVRLNLGDPDKETIEAVAISGRDLVIGSAAGHEEALTVWRDCRPGQRALALTCALHNRCGVNSPARILCPLLMHEVGKLILQDGFIGAEPHFYPKLPCYQLTMDKDHDVQQTTTQISESSTHFATDAQTHGVGCTNSDIICNIQ